MRDRARPQMLARTTEICRAQKKNWVKKKKKSSRTDYTDETTGSESPVCVCVCVCACVCVSLCGMRTSSILDSVLTSHNNKQLSETRVPQAHRLGS